MAKIENSLKEATKLLSVERIDTEFTEWKCLVIINYLFTKIEV